MAKIALTALVRGTLRVIQNLGKLHLNAQRHKFLVLAITVEHATLKLIDDQWYENVQKFWHPCNIPRYPFDPPVTGTIRPKINNKSNTLRILYFHSLMCIDVMNFLEISRPGRYQMYENCKTMVRRIFLKIKQSDQLLSSPLPTALCPLNVKTKFLWATYNIYFSFLHSVIPGLITKQPMSISNHPPYLHSWILNLEQKK